MLVRRPPPQRPSSFPSTSPFPGAANEPTLTLLTREQARTTERAVPVVSLKVAAGAFSAAQSLEDEADHWVQLPEGFAAAPGLFVAQVIGESMSRRIPNGTWCLFRAAPSGSRQGKIVLVLRGRGRLGGGGGAIRAKLVSA